VFFKRQYPTSRQNPWFRRSAKSCSKDCIRSSERLECIRLGVAEVKSTMVSEDIRISMIVTVIVTMLVTKGDIPLHSPYIGLIYGRYLHFRILKFPLKKWHRQNPFLRTGMTTQEGGTEGDDAQYVRRSFNKPEKYEAR